MHPAAGLAGRARTSASGALRLDLDPDLDAGRTGLAGRGLQLGDGPLQRIAVVQPGDVGEGAEPDEQRERLVDAQPERPGDRVGVGEVDVAVVPVDVDEVVGQVPGRAAHEEQLEVLDQLALGDAELRGGRRRAGCPAG